MSTEQSKQVVEDFLAAFSRGDVDAVVAGLHDDAQWWVLGSIEGLSGSYSKQQMAELLPNFTELYKSGALVITPSGMVGEGEKVAVEAEGYAELTNGRVYNSKYHFLFILDGDQVKEVKEYLDTHHAHSIFFT